MRVVLSEPLKKECGMSKEDADELNIRGIPAVENS